MVIYCFQFGYSVIIQISQLFDKCDMAVVVLTAVAHWVAEF